MHRCIIIGHRAVIMSLLLASISGSGHAQSATDQGRPVPIAAAERRDGQRDFDFEFGRWKTHLRRLVKPLTGSTVWLEYTGTTVVRKVWDGRANLVELNVEGPAGRIEGLSLRLYNPRGAAVEPQLFQQRERYVDVPNRGGILEWARRVLRCRHSLRADHPRPIRDHTADAIHVPLRAGVLRGWRQNVGSQLGCHRHTSR